MKRFTTSLSVLVAALFLIIAGGCHNLVQLDEPEPPAATPVQEVAPEGAVLVKLQIENNLFDSRTVNPVLDASQLEYHLYGTDSSRKNFSKEFKQGDVLQTWIPEGVWDLNLSVMGPPDSTGYSRSFFYSSAYGVSVLLSNPSTTIPFSLRYQTYIDENSFGSIEVTYTFPANPVVASMQYVLNKNVTGGPIAVSGSSGTISISDVPTGSYMLVVSFFDASGTFLGTKTDICYILWNTVSKANIVIPQGALNSKVDTDVPEAPFNLCANYVYPIGDFVQYYMTWEHNAGAARGFAVYRSGCPIPLAAVPAFKRDADISLPIDGTIADLYVVAFNTAGESKFSNTVSVEALRMFNVTINLNGGSINNFVDFYQSVEEGQPIELYGTPVKAGFAFAGFYRDAGFTEPFDIGTPIVEYVYLYTKWTPLDFVLTETAILTDKIVYKSAGSFTLGGELSSSEGLPAFSITRNGEVCEPVRDTATWSLSETSLSDGAYVYEIRASLAGIDQTLYRNITVDSVGPELVLSSSGPFTFTAEGHVFDGNATDLTSGVVRIEYSLDGGASWTLGSTAGGAWTLIFNDSVPGERTVQIKAVDMAGNSTILSVVYTNDFNVPYVVLSETAIGTDSQVALNADSITFTGTFEASETPVITVKRDDVVLGQAVVSGSSWSYADTVTGEGIYAYEIIGTVTGATTLVNRTILFDRTPPFANIVSPASPYTFLAGTVSFTVEPADSGSGVKSVEFSHDNAVWSPALKLDETTWKVSFTKNDVGKHSIYIRTTDNVDIASSVLSATYNVVAKAITITEDTYGTAAIQYTKLDSVNLYGSIISVNPVTLTLTRDSVPLTPTVSGTNWEFFEEGLSEGLHTYILSAFDGMAPSEIVERNVYVDSTQPVISVTSATTLFNAPTQEFSGTVSESGSGLNVLEYSQDNLNWIQIAPVDDLWTINLNDTVEGARQIFVRATDEAGNSNTITILYTNSFTGSVSVAVTIVNPAEPSLTFTPGTGTLSIPYSSTGDVTIGAPAGYTGYSWKLNGTVLAQTTNVCTINLSTGEAKDLYIMGTNTLSLIINNNGEYYSGSYTFTVTN